MKGRELIFLAAGATIGIVAFLTTLDGLTLQRQSDDCPHGNATQCHRQAIIAEGTLLVAPYLWAGAVLVAAVGVILILWRRWYTPNLPGPDEGPPYE